MSESLYQGWARRENERINAKNFMVKVVGPRFADVSKKYFCRLKQAEEYAIGIESNFPIQDDPGRAFFGTRIVKASVYKFDRWEQKNGKDIRIYRSVRKNESPRSL